MRMILALLLVSVLGAGALYAQTDGFTVLTTESARRNSIASKPRPVPDTSVQLTSGAPAGLRNVLESDGRVAIVNFIYTRCISVCLAMGSEFQQLQEQIVEQGLQGKVRLMSLSFDPADSPEQLTRYASSMRADSGVWQFMGMPDAAQRDHLLEIFGIIRVPAPYGQFEHNAAYHIVTPDGRLSRIVDYGQPMAALQAALAQP